MTPATPASQRFWAKVAQGADDDCWLWQGHRNSKGYGRFNSRMAHRVAYEATKGSIPDGLVIDHLCHRPPCVNPSHLEAVTTSVNALRGYNGAVGAALTRERCRAMTHCKRGHEFTPGNTYMHPRGWRQCRACKQFRKRRRA